MMVVCVLGLAAWFGAGWWQRKHTIYNIEHVIFCVKNIFSVKILWKSFWGKKQDSYINPFFSKTFFLKKFPNLK
jgi:hypothetical protein